MVSEWGTKISSKKELLILSRQRAHKTSWGSNAPHMEPFKSQTVIFLFVHTSPLIVLTSLCAQDHFFMQTKKQTINLYVMCVSEETVTYW